MATRTYQATITKGGGSKIILDIEAPTQSSAKKTAELIVKNTYPGYKVIGNPQPKK